MQCEFDISFSQETGIITNVKSKYDIIHFQHAPSGIVESNGESNGNTMFAANFQSTS